MPLFVLAPAPASTTIWPADLINPEILLSAASVSVENGCFWRLALCSMLFCTDRIMPSSMRAAASSVHSANGAPDLLYAGIRHVKSSNGSAPSSGFNRCWSAAFALRAPFFSMTFHACSCVMPSISFNSLFFKKNPVRFASASSPGTQMVPVISRLRSENRLLSRKVTAPSIRFFSLYPLLRPRS